MKEIKNKEYWIRQLRVFIRFYNKTKGGNIM